ncbi:dihydrofolate reductase family protein [Nonomuraea sp. MCN248]|uniref:Dihydrofolate reductase family protein n=1 Tax=Nonomuraea corallina TaxID=2989783 RepID=A0ABT4S3Z9_9ACTN|nr:dihydrofolate reductase family protein [Nonomuraea corallina]MDA0631932.1 dihydrofolate reductase family protein [Nonomuraea corallina]
MSVAHRVLRHRYLGAANRAVNGIGAGLMPSSVLDMSVSLDGYVATADDFLGGEDGHRLHNWFAPGGEFIELSGPVKELIDEMNACGAVVAGRRTAELMDHWGGDHNGLPIFVPSHRPPGPPARWSYPLVTYVTDGIESAMAQAKAAAGERHVHVVGGYTGQRALEAGVLDEIQIHQVPVLLGRGRRLFDTLPSEIELEVIRVIDTPEATHIRYRVRR